MKALKYLILSFTLLFFWACGTEAHIDPNKVFDLWNYMTSASSYEVNYDIYENGVRTNSYVETHRQFGDQYERESSSGKTTLYLSPSSILMVEPTGNVNITRYIHLGDRDIFQSPLLQLCSTERFYDTYRIKNSTFYNVLQITCRTNSGIYQEFYYGYNEGIVTLYEQDGNTIKEYVKISERAIF